MGDSHPSILHVWNTAGVACTLAKWTNKVYGVHTDVYAMEKHNHFGHLTYGEPRPETGGRFFRFALKNMSGFDIIHVHGLSDFVYVIKKYHPGKPVVLHYHGTDIRRRWNMRRIHWSQADAILVSTPDLLRGAPERATYLPNPVDPELFYPNPNTHEIDPDSALTLRLGAVELAKRLAEKHGLKLCVHSRNKKFLEMPQFLKQFSWYIDVRRDNDGKLLSRAGSSGSLTGLEASACGLKVINTDGEIRLKLPPQNRAENVVKTLHPIYVALME